MTGHNWLAGSISHFADFYWALIYKSLFSYDKLFMMIKSPSTRIVSLIPHVAIWGMMVFVFLISFVNTSSSYKVVEFLINSGTYILVFYTTSSLLIDLKGLTIQRKTKLLFLLLVFVLGCLAKELTTLLLKFIYHFDIIHTYSFNRIWSQGYSIGLFMVISAIYTLIRYFKLVQKRELELKHEKSLAELQNLKAQVNPHFLFNTLNNLYYLCLKKDDVAPEMILKLSDLMRYIVTVGKQDWVEIGAEVKQLLSYVDLEKMRLRKPDCIHVHIDLQDEKHKVAPLLLLPFIENAFKHCKNKIDNGITIVIKDCKDEFSFSIENSFDGKGTTDSTGTGLENIKRRLDLVYPNLHQLQITQLNHTFKVQLNISYHAPSLYRN